MGKKIKTGKARKDRFYFLAKETGYRCRAAFKLIQLNRRFNFLNTSSVLLDLCAAPGGWLQVASKEMPVSSQIIGVDLVPIQPIPRVKTIVADITTDRCKQLIRNELGRSKADVVLHDGAPNVGTAWSIDEYTQANLCLQAFALATEFLKKGGYFITKVFRSRDYEPLKWVLSQFFRTVRAVKPEASRLESAEIFLVAQAYKAPDHIDSRFLDARSVFEDVEAPKERAAVVSNLLKECKKKRKAEGYAEGDTLYREVTVSEFVDAADPLAFLANINKILIDDSVFSCHPLTTNELLLLFEDIRVLGRADLKNLLKWRKKVKEAVTRETEATDPLLSTQQNSVTTDAGTDVVDGDDKEEMEVEAEVQRLLEEEHKDQKKRLKRVRKAKMKLAERLVMKMEHEGDRIEQNEDELFSLSTVTDFVALEQGGQLVGDSRQTGADCLARTEQQNTLTQTRKRLAEERKSAVEGSKRFHFERRNDDLPDMLDEEEDHIQSVQRHREDLYIGSDESDGEMDASDDSNSSIHDVFDEEQELRSNVSTIGDTDGEDSGLPQSSDDSETEEIVPVSKHVKTTDLKKSLSVKKGKTSSGMTATASNSSGALLASLKPITGKNPLLMDLDDTEESVKNKRTVRNWMESDELKNLLASPEEFSDELSDGEEESDTKKKRAEKKKSRKKAKKAPIDLSLQSNSTQTPTDFNEVPQDSNVSSQKLKRLRRPLTADERALALRLVRSAKSRRELIESGYHRFQFFEDATDLPDWFTSDEMKHMRKLLPLSDAERLIDRPTMGRSIKKVEEAKARQKGRFVRRLKRVREKADAISEDVTEAEKWQQIKQMYKKAGVLKKKRRPIQLVVNTKAGARNSTSKVPKGTKVKLVDRRLKADLRGQKKGGNAKNKRSGKGPRARSVKLLARKPPRRATMKPKRK